MKVIFFHADRFGFAVESPSERLGGATPEEVRSISLELEECLVNCRDREGSEESC